MPHRTASADTAVTLFCPILAGVVNPVIFADVPDPDVIFDGENYYMVSTTMYFAPSVPIMRSPDMVNWEIAGYTAPILDETDQLALRNGENAYGKGTWAASIRYHNKVYYISVASLTTQQTYIYSTPSIEKGPWTRSVLDGYAHDQSLLFDDDKVYLIYGAGKLLLRELQLQADGTFTWQGSEIELLADASIAPNRMLPAEGVHAYRIGDYYYFFMIEWPQNGVRQEIVWRSASLTPQSQGGRWEGRILFSQGVEVAGRPGTGVAQGGVVQGAQGDWFTMLFQDEGPLGRSPQLGKVFWEDSWPVVQFGSTYHKSTDTGAIGQLMPGIVTNDDFHNSAPLPGYWNSTNSRFLMATAENAPNGSNLALPWQWNHNPDNRYWSLTERPSHLRLTTSHLATGLLDARNTLTQRTVGPASWASIKIDVSAMHDGDVAGLGALQKIYGYVAVEREGGAWHLVMRRSDRTGEVVSESAPVSLNQTEVYLRVETNFADRAYLATFAYSLDGETWQTIGDGVHMEFRLDHFTGYRFAIFNYATKSTGGYVDVDWFAIGQSPE